MANTVHHPVALPSRGLIICETDEDSAEQKTILEIGGVSRPRPTYLAAPIIRPQPTPVPAMATTNHQYMGHWKAEHHEIVMPPFQACTEFQEQRILRVPNTHWIPTPERPNNPSPPLMTPPMSRGKC